MFLYVHKSKFVKKRRFIYNKATFFKKSFHIYTQRNTSPRLHTRHLTALITLRFHLKDLYMTSREKIIGQVMFRVTQVHLKVHPCS